MLVAVDVRGLDAYLDYPLDLCLDLGPDLGQPEPANRPRPKEREPRSRQPSIRIGKPPDRRTLTHGRLSYKREVDADAQLGVAQRDPHGVIERRAVGHQAGATEYALMKRRLDPAVDPSAQPKVVGVDH